MNREVDFRDRKITFGRVAIWSMTEWMLSEAEVEEAIRNHDNLWPYKDGSFGIITSQTRTFAIGAHIVEAPDGSLDVRYVYGMWND